MKINSAIPPVGNAPDGGRTRTTNNAARRPSTEGDSQVELSPLSSRLQEIAGAGQVVDTKRVAEIKQAIAEGRFKIDPERIADGLLSSVRQMLSKSS